MGSEGRTPAELRDYGGPAGCDILPGVVTRVFAIGNGFILGGHGIRGDTTATVPTAHDHRLAIPETSTPPPGSRSRGTPDPGTCSPSAGKLPRPEPGGNPW